MLRISCRSESSDSRRVGGGGCMAGVSKRHVRGHQEACHGPGLFGWVADWASALAAALALAAGRLGIRGQMRSRNGGSWEQEPSPFPKGNETKRKKRKKNGRGYSRSRALCSLLLRKCCALVGHNSPGFLECFVTISYESSRRPGGFLSF